MATPEIRSDQHDAPVRAAISFASVPDLMQALIRAAIAHGKHERRTGRRDENWPRWYAAHMVAEQTGAELPV
ncbi:glyoxalase [Nocardia lijiangensis]|uniref:glyoxalase n=1 Tax=Nocardia lijiangensis TaxID=299618 RepID=UPI003D73736B